MQAVRSTGSPRFARRVPALPREHGFWVMLGAVVLTALARSFEAPAAWIAALAVVVFSSFAGGAVSASIRKREGRQLASAAALSFGGVPIELAGGAPLSAALVTAGAWAAVFMASAFSVRASFARTARGGRAKARRLTFASVALPLVASLIFALGGLTAEAAAALVGALGSGALALIRPGVKRLKGVGLTLAGVAALAAAALLAL